VQDERITFAEWGSNPDLKAGTPFGQLPVLEVDGKRIAQSAAIGEGATATVGCSYETLTTAYHLGLLIPIAAAVIHLEAGAQQSSCFH